jgi:two-component system invasion response regulator UvrY
MHKISDELCLGFRTVANYGARIKSKLKSTTAELAYIAMVLDVMKG